MSILIKNMEMPKCCDVCQFCSWSSFHQTAACEVHDNDPCFDDFSIEYREKRSNICPLVEFSKDKDAVSRQAVIKLIKHRNYHLDNFDETYVMIGDVERLPFVQPKIKWTSISEKLPDEGIDVLCKTESGFRTIASYSQLYPNDEEKGWITAEFNRFQTNFFEKWRPLIEDDD